MEIIGHTCTKGMTEKFYCSYFRPCSAMTGNARSWWYMRNGVIRFLLQALTGYKQAER